MSVMFRSCLHRIRSRVCTHFASLARVFLTVFLFGLPISNCVSTDVHVWNLDSLASQCWFKKWAFTYMAHGLYFILVIWWNQLRNLAWSWCLPFFINKQNWSMLIEMSCLVKFLRMEIFIQNDASPPKKSWLQISVKSVKLFGCKPYVFCNCLYLIV